MSTTPPDDADRTTPGAVPPPPPAGYGAPQDASYPQQPYGQPGQYPPPAYGTPQYQIGAPLSPSDQRLWAILSHVGGVFVSFLVPLVVWLVFKGRGAFVEDQAKEALNFQITVAIAYAVGFVLLIVGIGVLILITVWVLSVIFAIIAAVKASQGELYRYPLTIRFIN